MSAQHPDPGVSQMLADAAKTPWTDTYPDIPFESASMQAAILRAVNTHEQARRALRVFALLAEALPSEIPNGETLYVISRGIDRRAISAGDLRAARTALAAMDGTS